MGPRSGGSVTRWVWALRDGVEASRTAMSNLWDRYSKELERAARAVLKTRPIGRSVADEGDAASKGFHGDLLASLERRVSRHRQP